MKKQGVHLHLSDLQGAGNTPSGDFSMGAALPNDAQIIGTQIITTTPLAGPGMTAAIAKIGLSAASPPQNIVTGDLTTQGTYNSGGQQFQTTITLTGCQMAQLTAGEMYAIVYYTEFTQVSMPLPIID